MAIAAWNLLGGELRWEALDTVAALIGAENIEALAADLATIREHFRKLAEIESRQRA